MEGTKAANSNSTRGTSSGDAPVAGSGHPWWRRDDLDYAAGRLQLAGQDLEHLARSAGEPVFAYSGARLAANLQRLRQALSLIPQPSRVLYAMKANRFLPVLGGLQAAGIDGIDACSPEEVRLARQAGFREDQISFTGTSVSNADLDCLAAHPGTWVNCDSISSLRRLGERSADGRKVGLRINPELGIGYRENETLQYAGAKPTKFGIYLEQIDEALSVARDSNLEITGLHLHAGCGWLEDQLPRFRAIMERVQPFLEKIPHLESLNLGGGLGIPLEEGDAPLNLDHWGETLAEILAPVAAEILIEPGDYLVKDAGCLVLEVNTVEEKAGRRFVGVNGGFNLHVEPAFYDLPLVIVPCRQPTDTATLEPMTVAGNINEALDLFAEDLPLPPLKEGDYLAFLNAGGYGSSMSSQHCLRGQFREYFVPAPASPGDGRTSTETV